MANAQVEYKRVDFQFTKHATVRLLRSRLGTSLAFRRCIAGWK